DTRARYIFGGRAAASGRRAHQRCSVLGCPCRIDFSLAQALLIASSGRATSISFFAEVTCAKPPAYRHPPLEARKGDPRVPWHPWIAQKNSAAGDTPY